MTTNTDLHLCTKHLRDEYAKLPIYYIRLSHFISEASDRFSSASMITLSHKGATLVIKNQNGRNNQLLSNELHALYETAAEKDYAATKIPNCHWNYRLILHDQEENSGDNYIALHEVHYEKNVIKFYSIAPTTFVCDAELGPNDLIKSLEKAWTDARKHPMIIESELNKLLEHTND